MNRSKVMPGVNPRGRSWDGRSNDPVGEGETMRIVISDTKTGKSYQKELPKEKEGTVSGKKIGESIEGDELGLPGYTLELTGGSDIAGFPMRKDISGARRLKPLISDGVGYHALRKGTNRRKTVRGNVYSPDVVQVNTRVVKAGTPSLEELFPKKEEKKA